MGKTNCDCQAQNRLEVVQALVDEVYLTLVNATAHGRILVGPPDESGIGDDTFPAWARRNHRLDKNDSLDKSMSTGDKDENDHLDSDMEEDTVSEESSILSVAPPPVDRYEELEKECKKLLDHTSKIIEAETILYPPPKKVLQNTDGEEAEEEFYEPLLPLTSRNELLVVLTQNSNIIVPFHHSKCGISERRRSRSLAWGDKIHEMGMVGHPGGPINKPARFTMFDGTFVNPLEQTFAPYITLLPELTFDPHEAEMERRRLHQEKLRIEKIHREEEERKRLAIMKEFLRERRAAKESISRIWKKPTWIKDFRGNTNGGNGYSKEFNILTRKRHASNYALSASPFDALGPKKMKQIIALCKKLDVKQPRKYIRKVYRKYFVMDDTIGPPGKIIKYSAPGAIDMDVFVRDLGFKDDFSTAFKLLGVHVDHRGGILPFDTFMNNTIRFALLSPIQLISYVLYVVSEIEAPSEGYLLRNMHRFVNVLHGTAKYPVIIPKTDLDDNDSDSAEENFIDESLLFSIATENKDKMDLAVSILNNLSSNATHVELLEALFDYPVLIWPAFDIQRRVRRKLRGELYWKGKIINDENLKMLQKEVHAANMKQRARDLKNQLRKEKLMRKKKNKDTHAEIKSESEDIEKKESKEQIAEVAQAQVTPKEPIFWDIKDTDVATDEKTYTEIEDLNPRLFELSRYVQIVKHHEMSETLAWGLTARKLVVEGARRRHVGSLLANGVVGSIFGRSRTRKGKIVLIQIWWKIFCKRRNLQRELDKILSAIQARHSTLEEKLALLKNGNKSGKLQKQIKKMKMDLCALEAEAKEISEADALSKSIRIQIQEMEEKLSKQVAKPSYDNNDEIIQKYLSKQSSVKTEINNEHKITELEDVVDTSRGFTASAATQGNQIKNPDMVITSEVSTEFREGYCIVPHCNTIINLVDPEESIGMCSTCRIYSINYCAMENGYKWGYRMIRRIHDSIVVPEPDHLECNSWMLFRDPLIRTNFYFNIETGHSRWQLAPWHKKNKKSFMLVKDDPVIAWEKAKEEKREFRRKIIAAKRAKAEAMKKTSKGRPKYPKKNKK